MTLSNLRWIYERYRTASKAALHVVARKPGEWLEIHPKTPEAGFVQEVSGIDTSTASGLASALKYLTGMRLNELLGVTSPLDVRISHFRNGASKKMYLRFYCAAPGKKQGAAGVPRSDLPAAATFVQIDLIADSNQGALAPESVSSSGGVRPAVFAGTPENPPDGRHLENSHVSDDQPVPVEDPLAGLPTGFDDLLDVEALDRFLASGAAEEDNDLANFVRDSIEEARTLIEGEDLFDPHEVVRSLMEKIEVSDAMPPILDLEAPEPQEWHTASGQVVDATLSLCQKYRTQKGKLAILCPSPSGGKPLHEDTLVTMADGSRRPIKALRVGDRVISGAGRITPVLAVYDQGELDVLEITCRSGRSVIAEGTHRFLTQRGWIEAKDLHQYDRRKSGQTKGRGGEILGRGDSLQIVHGFLRESNTMPASEARFLGYMTGDGCVTEPSSLRFSNVDPDVLFKFSETCKSLGLWLRQINKIDWYVGYSSCPKQLTASERSDRRQELRRLALAERTRTGSSGPKVPKHPGRVLLTTHGLIGKKSAEKRVPPNVFTADDRAICEFIAAYFECDGTRTERAPGATWKEGGKVSASFSSVSKGLLVDVQTLLGRLGIRSTLRLKNGIYNGKRHVSWRLGVLDLVRFFEMMPIVGAKSGKSAASRRREPDGCHAPDVIMTVTPAGRARCLCITVADDESFIANDFATHNTHGMVLAARAERSAGKRVGYAVLARGKLMEEAKERLTGGDQQLVQLHVIEGRHAGNCVEYESVEQAAALGYPPGTQVCPKCDKYPNLSNPFSSLDRNATCEYYASRLRALRDMKYAKEYNNPLIRPYPLILTTHASLVIGISRLRPTFRRLPSLWELDTVFIDEDPSAALEQTFVIKEEQLIYEWRDEASGKPDAHTQMTRVLKGMFALGRTERHIAWSGGYRDTIHTRDYGSTYASNDLIALLYRSAKSLGYDLKTVLAQVINESSVKSPKRGELLNMRGDVAAKRYPHRHLLTITSAIRDEIETREKLPDNGDGADLAYRVHMHLALRAESDPMTPGDTDGTITLSFLDPFATCDANVVIGDAYASVEHYENLFRRYRRHGDVDIVNHRVKWPQSSLLIRIPTRCATGDFPTDASYLQHCDTALMPLLGMEQDRRVLLYTHKGSRDLLDEWLQQNAGGFGLETYAIEHWGSGRGKDIYRDFDTFVAVTEYLPNIYGLVHEANARVAQSNALTPRIYFWNSGAKRADGISLTNAITNSSPALSNAFQRRAIDELAQAVHRIRPAKPRGCESCGELLKDDPRQCSACGTIQTPARWQKRCWVLGRHVPMSMELLAATCTTTIDEITGLIKRDGNRGARVSVHPDLGLLGFVSPREIATAMGEVHRGVGCWSPAFAHTLEGVPLSAAVSRALDHVSFAAEGHEAGEPFSRDLYGLRRFMGGAPSVVPLPAGHWGESSRLVDRVYSPPKGWREISDRVVTLPMYRAGLKIFLAEAASARGRPLQSYRVKRDWMPKTSHGIECLGDPRRLEAVIEYYSPNPPTLPF